MTLTSHFPSSDTQGSYLSSEQEHEILSSGWIVTISSDMHIAFEVLGFAQNGAEAEHDGYLPQRHCPDAISQWSDPLVLHFIPEHGSIGRGKKLHQ